MAKSPRLLTQEQERFLALASKNSYLRKHFYLTGGTPLAAFYLRHRISEDLDLFSESEINLLSVRAFVKTAQRALAATEVDYRQFLGLHTFQLYTRKAILKVDFNYYPFPRIEKGIRYLELDIDSILDIAVNKVHTVAMKPRARDFIDLYFIIHEKGYNFFDLLMKAKAKFDWHIDPIQLGSRLLAAAELSDYPRMLKSIEHKEWRDFFVNEARQLKKEIFE